MHDVWTLSETYGAQVKDVSFELLARSRDLADTLGVHLGTLVLGSSIPDEQLERLIAQGADIVYVIDDPRLGNFVCDRYAAVLASLINEYHPQIVLGAATTTGRTLLPYVAVKVHAGLTADCTGLAIEEGTGNLLQTRPAIGGNILATIKTPDHRPQMATIRPRSTKPLAYDPTRSGTIVRLAFKSEWDSRKVEVLGVIPFSDQPCSLEEAPRVVAGGRGLKKKEYMALVEHLAGVLDAQVGASREAVDRQWIGYPHQVGLSGKTISPRLYLALGISGAIQHLAGIKTSECIVAVNTDEHANILGLADFAIIGDLFRVIPELEKQLSERRKA
ncbi:MAG: electron transfer flavoprotein subunit alpha/FixB family protein [Sphaerochaeta sp.]|uniref:electron transfer flavoprotein subunit alpha/FixB family protein n=1 Tax=Sphaerochaeta sp. TaxID=1972642 RepID=UPI002FCBFF54